MLEVERPAEQTEGEAPAPEPAPAPDTELIRSRARARPAPPLARDARRRCRVSRHVAAL